MKGIVAVLVILAAGGCGPHPLANAQPSADALAREVLSAFARRDHVRLHSLALNETEFERRVWPGLPAAQPQRNLPWSYVWMDLRQKSDTVLTRTLNEHGDRTYQLQQVRFDGPSTSHGTYRVHREAVLVVGDAAAKPVELRVFGSMIEADGGWKVFSYVVDD